MSKNTFLAATLALVATVGTEEANATCNSCNTPTPTTPAPTVINTPAGGNGGNGFGGTSNSTSDATASVGGISIGGANFNSKSHSFGLGLALPGINQASTQNPAALNEGGFALFGFAFDFGQTSDPNYPATMATLLSIQNGGTPYANPIQQNFAMGAAVTANPALKEAYDAAMTDASPLNKYWKGNTANQQQPTTNFVPVYITNTEAKPVTNAACPADTKAVWDATNNVLICKPN